ncbi:helix-turn-helix domain-containing protein [Salipaludibacillus agaradhaerens]|uniref:Helix-turn-helix domain-containing protein n=1 Tax=Salipaludibacillus agaradhaerens TaxID=76935 RepID=A0A9Q4AYQ8_SALAG|nr:helix-turn-helix domain-containing protein [Salipaludibacillus agaradhaerens]MCR6095286.1 helix-turn-helix domain-containing protein [Salipaludibacillus agaradhaerens]MCR6115156.1 helix-turn-helix domain-containing protein [Salipaludibacillus agaradhaerens]
MKQRKIDVVLHPIRMQLIQALIKKPMTVQELLNDLQGVAQATLYRHLNLLKDHHIIRIKEERQVRGAVEKTYELLEGAAIISAEEAETITKEEHQRYFLRYFAMILKQFDDYLEGDVNMEQDGFGYTQIELALTDEEFQSFTLEFSELLKRYGNKMNSQARKRTLSTILLPEKKGGGEKNDRSD